MADSGDEEFFGPPGVHSQGDGEDAFFQPPPAIVSKTREVGRLGRPRPVVESAEFGA